MTQFFRDFSEYTPGDLATVGAADWTASTLVGDWQLDVVADAGPGGIPALVSSRTVSGDALTFARFTASETAGDIEVFARHAANAYSVNIGFGPTLLQADNAAYALAAVSATQVRLWRFGTTGGTSGNIATADFALVAGTPYNIRIGRSGTTIRAKIWAVGDSEPGTWMMQGTDTALGTVQGGVYARKFELQPQITTAFGVGTAGDPAPTSGGPAGPAITDVDGDDTVFEGQTSVQINGSGFGATQGTGSVTISPTDDINDVNSVTPTISTWSDTQITLSAVNFPAGVAEGGTAYVFVTDDSAASNAAGHAITRLDITAPLLSAGTATGVTGTEATPEVTTNEATGQAWMVLVPSAESTPSAAQIKAGQNAAGGSPVASGTVNPVSATTITFAGVTGLTPSTSYKIAFVQDDDSANESNVTTHTFSTAALPTITTSALRQNNGTLIGSQTGIVANVYNTTTGALVVRKTALSTDASGILSFNDAAMAAATEYLVHIEYDTGGGVMADGVARLTAT